MRFLLKYHFLFFVFVLILLLIPLKIIICDNIIVSEFNKKSMDSLILNRVESLVINIKKNYTLPNLLENCNWIKFIYFLSRSNIKNFDISVLSRMDSLDVLLLYGFNGLKIKYSNKFFPLLRVLSITSCNIIEIPLWVSKLNRLSYLEISDDRISNIPIFIADMKNLKELSINKTKIETIPPEIFANIELWTLSLVFNYSLKLEKFFKNINNNKVGSLSIEFSRIKKIPPEVEYLSSVQRLSFGYNNLHNLPNEIVKLKLLRDINLSKNKFKIFPNVLTEIESLEVIEMDSNEIKSIPYNLIIKMKNIKRISLIGNPISGQEKERILKELPHIKINF